MSCLFSFCCGTNTGVIETNIENTLKKPLTNASLVSVVDELEKGLLEQVLEPAVAGLVQKATGMDISGVITGFIKSEIEPAVEGVLNNEVTLGLTVVEKVAAPVLEPLVTDFETDAVPLLNALEGVAPSLQGEIEEAKTVVADTASLLGSQSGSK